MTDPIQRNQIAKNTATRLVTLAAESMTGILLVPFLLWRLGPEVFGLIVVLGSITTIAAMGDLGLRSALVRQLTAAMVRDEWRAAGRLLGTAAAVLAVTSVALSAVIGIASSQLTIWLRVPAQLAPTAKLLLVTLVPITVFTAFVVPVLTAPLAALNRFDIKNRLQLRNWFVRNALLVSCLLAKPDLYGWAISVVTSSVIYVHSVWFWTRRLVPELCGTLAVDGESARELWGMGRLLMLRDVVGVLKLQLHPIMISSLIGPMAVAQYRPGVALATSVRSLANAFAGQMDPLATRLRASGDVRRLEHLMTDGSRLVVWLSMPMVLVLVVFAKPICHVWLGRAGLGEGPLATAATVMALAAVVEFIRMGEGMAWPVLMGLGRIEMVVRTDVAVAVMSLLSAVVLIEIVGMDVSGILVPLVIGECVARPLYVRYATRLCGISLRRHCTAVYGRSSVLFAGLLAMSLTVRIVVRPASLWTLALCVGLVLSAWLVAFWLFGVGAEHRAWLVNAARTNVANWQMGRGGDPPSKET